MSVCDWLGSRKRWEVGAAFGAAGMEAVLMPWRQSRASLAAYAQWDGIEAAFRKKGHGVCR